MTACPCHDPLVFGHLRLNCPQATIADVPIYDGPEAAIVWASAPVMPEPVRDMAPAASPAGIRRRLAVLAGRR